MNGQGPIFVAGCPRSGTSALSWAIAACPGLWTSVETHFFYYLLREHDPEGASQAEFAYAQSSQSGSWLSAHDVSRAEYLEALGHGLDGLMRSRSGGLRWIDSSPENLLVAPLLMAVFPEARFVHVVRDPRHVCYSMLTSGFPEPWARDLGTAIDTWRHYIESGLIAERLEPTRTLRVRHEDIVSAREAVARSLADFLALPSSDYIHNFLTDNQVNSSLHRGTYVEGSETTVKATGNAADREQFIRDHGSEILDRCDRLADEVGYRESVAN